MCRAERTLDCGLSKGEEQAVERLLKKMNNTAEILSDIHDLDGCCRGIYAAQLSLIFAVTTDAEG